MLYHHISNTPSAFENGLGVTTPVDLFTSHIDYFAKRYNFVDLDTVLSGKLPPRALLITFDDYYKSVETAARDILKPRGIPSLFFINPGLLGSESMALDNLLAYGVNTYGMDKVCDILGLERAAYPDLTSIFTGLITHQSATNRADIHAKLSEAFLKNVDYKTLRKDDILTREDLKSLKGLGVTIGSHSYTHVNCGALTPDEYEQELIRSRHDLESWSGQEVKSFSFAYGHERDATKPVLDTLRSTGFEAIFLVHKRSNFFPKPHDIWYRTSFDTQPQSAIFKNTRILPIIRSMKAMVK